MLKQLIALVRVVLLSTAALMSMSCASLLNTPTTMVTIDSKPQNAHFVITNHAGDIVHSGVTPDEVELHNSKAMFQRAEYAVSYESAGLAPQTTELKATLYPLYFGNILFLHPGLFGFFIIDPFTGAIYDLPREHSVDLEASSAETDSLNTAQRSEQ